MTAKSPQPRPENAVRPPAPAAPPRKKYPSSGGVVIVTKFTADQLASGPRIKILEVWVE